MSKKSAIVWIVGALILSMSTGCSRGDTMIDPNAVDESPQTNNNATTPISNNDSGNNIYNPGGSAGQNQAAVQVTASISNKTTSGVWIFKKIKTVTVQLQNPSNQSVTGKVTVTFSKKGSQTETVDKQFSLTGGQSTTIDVQPTKSSDDAVVTPTTDPTTGSSTTSGGGSGWPANGGTGSGSTAWPS